MKTSSQIVKDTKALIASFDTGVITGPKDDKVVGRQVQKLKYGLVIATKDGGEMKGVDLGGDKQIVQLTNQINGLSALSSKLFFTPDVLQGDPRYVSGTCMFIGDKREEDCVDIEIKQVE